MKARGSYNEKKQTYWPTVDYWTTIACWDAVASTLIINTHSPEEEHQGKPKQKANILTYSRLLDCNSLLGYSSFKVDDSEESPAERR